MEELLHQAVEAVADHGGNVAAAAKTLGVARSTLWDRVKKAGEAGIQSPAVSDSGQSTEKKRIAELERLVQKQQERIENLNKSKFKIPTSKGSIPKGDCVRIAVPDTHGCKVDEQAIAAFLSDLEALGPSVKEVVLLGDHLDCGGFLAQHFTMGYVDEAGYTFEEDVAACNHFLDKVQELCKNAMFHYLDGNHECLTPDHEVLTDRGWVYIADVTTDDIVFSMSDSGDTLAERPLACHSYDYSGEIITHSGPYYRIKMTPQHRVWYWGQSESDLICRKAWKLASTTTTVKIPASSKNKNREYENVSDDDIRLLAWILTDGSITKNGVVCIYQSKPQTVEIINSLLLRMGLDFSVYRRWRKSGSFKSNHESHTFTIKASSRRGVLSHLFGDPGATEKTIPDWVRLLSDRQMDIFVETLILGDGTRVKSAWCLYGKRQFLDEIQALLVTSGYRASLARRRNSSTGGWYECLNITKRSKIKIQCGNLKREQYSGKVHCLTTKCDNFFVRLKGVVSVTGNSRIEKFCVTSALRNQQDANFLLSLFGPHAVLHLDDRGIKYYRQSVRYDGLPIPGTIRLGKCYFTHGSRTGQNPAKAMLSDFGGNVVFGHVHRSDSYTSRTVSEGVIGAWTPGCLCKLQPLYSHTQVTGWSHGYGMQLVRDNGDFLHVNVPIIDGKSYLTQLTDRVVT